MLKKEKSALPYLSDVKMKIVYIVFSSTESIKVKVLRQYQRMYLLVMVKCSKRQFSESNLRHLV